MRYVHRPTAVDAVQWTGDRQSCAEVYAFVEAAGGPIPDLIACADHGSHLRVFVRKGRSHARLNRGDWVIREADGEGVYPCTAEAFEASYEPAPVHRLRNVNAPDVPESYAEIPCSGAECRICASIAAAESSGPRALALTVTVRTEAEVDAVAEAVQAELRRTAAPLTLIVRP